jgi:glycine oxidase
MSDCLVIGGGIIGMLTAIELNNAGMQVTIIDRGHLGQACSWAGGGILAQLHAWRENPVLDPLVNLSQKLYPELVNELIAETGIDPEWQMSGMLVLDPDNIKKALSWGLSNDIQIEHITGKDIQDLEPALTMVESDALWLPEVAQVRNPRLLKAMRSFLLNIGVKIIEDLQVSKILITRSHITGIETARGVIDADKVIIATGAWSAGLLNTIDHSLPIKPVRGQMISYQLPENKLQRILLKDEHYVIPRIDGLVLSGSTVEDVGFINETTEGALEGLRRAAEEIYPGINDHPLTGHWSGLRPGSPEGVPVIDACPDVEGLFLNAGHYRNGVLLAPASARLMADIVCKTPECIEKKPFEWRVNSAD